MTVVFRSGELTCALPIGQVVETMRLLPITPVDDMPPFVLGLAVIRGTHVPVVGLGRLLGVDSAPTRLLTVRADDRVVALAVDEISGVRPFERTSLERRPPLLNTEHPLVQSVALRDRAVYLVLDAARIVRDGRGER